MPPVICGFRASASVTCISEIIKAWTGQISAGETEWRKQEALLLTNSWKIHSIPVVGGKAKMLSQCAVLPGHASTGPRVKRGNRKRKPMFLGWSLLGDYGDGAWYPRTHKPLSKPGQWLKEQGFHCFSSLKWEAGFFLEFAPMQSALLPC